MRGQETESENILKSLPENLFEFVNPESLPEQRLMAAQGIVPLAPADMVKVLFCLTFDSDENIIDEAKKSLNEVPENVMTGVLLDDSTVPEFLDYVAKNIDTESYVQSVLLNSSTLDSTYAYLAKTQHSQDNIDIIANNRQRILRSMEIVECLSSNPAVSISALNGVLSFISLHLEKDRGVKKVIGDAQTEEHEKDREAKVGIRGVEELEEVEESFLDDIEISDDLIEEYSDEEVTDGFKQSILLKIGSLNIAEKIKLALLGNMESRKLLIRDGNKIVSRSVLRNPRLTDMEIVLISQSKVVDEEILRQVAENKKWTRLYQVKLALVNNPRTPVRISLSFLKRLRIFDIRAIQFNRDIPGVVSQAAKEIQKAK